MKLPNRDHAIVPKAKVVDYLLNVEHEDGHGKALFFIHFGFSPNRDEELAQALIDHAQKHEVTKQETTRFGTRYVVEGALQTPSGRTPHVRVVWFIARDAQNPRLATSYPLEAQNDD